MTSGPFKPAFAGKVLPVGCSDKNTRWHLLRGDICDEPKLTTYGRATAAIEQYWAEQAAKRAAAHTAVALVGASPAASPAKASANLPGGETALAHKTREACWKDSVQLAQQPGRYIPAWQGVPADIEEKEAVRTRGIPGFTGKQPPPGLSRPPPEPPNTSGYVAINAFDERRPRVKGIPGYTGHQPPSPRAGPASMEPYDHEDQFYDHNTHMWVTPMPQQTAVEAAAAAAAADQRYYEHHQQQLYPVIPQPASGAAESQAAAAAAAVQPYMSKASQLGACNAQQQPAVAPIARKLQYPARFAEPPMVEEQQGPAGDAVHTGYGPGAVNAHVPASAQYGGPSAYSAASDRGPAQAYDQGRIAGAAAARDAAAGVGGGAYGVNGPSAAAAGLAAAAAAYQRAAGINGVGAYGYAPAAAADQSAADHFTSGVSGGIYSQPGAYLAAAGGLGKGPYSHGSAAAQAPATYEAADQGYDAQHNSYTVYPSAPLTAAGPGDRSRTGAAGSSGCHQQYPQQQLAGRTPVGDNTVGSSLAVQPSATMPAAASAAGMGSGRYVAHRPSAFSTLPRTRQTTYAATYTPTAGFGQLLQQKMNSLQPYSPGSVACVPKRL